MSTDKEVAEVIAKHEANGRYLTVEDIRTFVLDEGEGEVVFCIHGVPTSSFLYRKVIKDLAAKGMRGVCVDLPGLGLSDRPEDFDYTFPGFARFLARATEELGIAKYHLVVHDIGGPIGFALAAEHKEKILSLTILNTWIDVVHFKKPLPMRLFEVPLLGEAELKSITHTTWHLGFSKAAVEHTEAIPKEEIYAYVDLLKRQDNGAAFLKIMRHFDKSEEFGRLCMRAVENVPYPVQAIWGTKDPGLTYERYGEEIKLAANLAEVHKLGASHFLQEEKPEDIAELVVEQARKGK
ncbi:alpha/beta fold hydrolase [Pontibacter mangrovi]|uniref:Alpha/beta fold hydrolase n=1 Tax=Pontibacter mangrovi TaxID=2589816 RepID=A0A501W9S3_9BACT|nr:alpha/beta fold hydrolase [Pontibacter mangrovi]TPE46349.1 alpha/beta fold hydrolase [Pontibacter mangrovi]